MNKRQLRKTLRKAIMNEMAKGPPDPYNGEPTYVEDKSQFNDAHTALSQPLGYAAGMADVSGDLFFVLMDIFHEAFRKGMSREEIAGVAQDAARDFEE